MPGSGWTRPKPHRPPRPTHPDQTATAAGSGDQEQRPAVHGRPASADSGSWSLERELDGGDVLAVRAGLLDPALRELAGVLDRLLPARRRGYGRRRCSRSPARARRSTWRRSGPDRRRRTGRRSASSCAPRARRRVAVLEVDPPNADVPARPAGPGRPLPRSSSACPSRGCRPVPRRSQRPKQGWHSRSGRLPGWLWRGQRAAPAAAARAREAGEPSPAGRSATGSPHGPGAARCPR